MTSRHPRGSAAVLALLGAALVALVAAATALAAPPRETLQPTLEGEFRRGSVIRTSTGQWANNPTSFSYRWQRCNSTGGACETIPRETSDRYRLRPENVGRTVRAIVTARNADGTGQANTKPTPVIADDVTLQNSQAPTITGTPTVGSTLTADPGSWTGAPSFQFMWLQCDQAGANCGDTNARGRQYGVRSDDLGRTIRVQVRATNPRGSSTAQSAQTGVVLASGGGGGGGGGAGPAVAVSQVSLPDRLVISAFASSPSTYRNRTDTVTLRVRVSDTRGRLIQGALVLASAVPFGRVQTQGETATDGNGIATVVTRPTFRLPLQRGSSVVFFLRARKTGDNLLAGVSTRRLVQVRVIPG